MLSPLQRTQCRFHALWPLASGLWPSNELDLITRRPDLVLRRRCIDDAADRASRWHGDCGCRNDAGRCTVACRESVSTSRRALRQTRRGQRRGRLPARSDSHPRRRVGRRLLSRPGIGQVRIPRLVREIPRARWIRYVRRKMAVYAAHYLSPGPTSRRTPVAAGDR